MVYLSGESVIGACSLLLKVIRLRKKVNLSWFNDPQHGPYFWIRGIRQPTPTSSVGLDGWLTGLKS